jgi:hypothetical protein
MVPAILYSNAERPSLLTAHFCSIFGLSDNSWVKAEGTTSTIAKTEHAPASGIPTVPTAKLLAIGRWTAKGTPNARKPLLPSEMRETAGFYLAGKIDQWFFKTDESGVVLQNKAQGLCATMT